MIRMMTTSIGSVATIHLSQATQTILKMNLAVTDLRRTMMQEHFQRGSDAKLSMAQLMMSFQILRSLFTRAELGMERRRNHESGGGRKARPQKVRVQGLTRLDEIGESQSEDTLLLLPLDTDMDDEDTTEPVVDLAHSDTDSSKPVSFEPEPKLHSFFNQFPKATKKGALKSSQSRKRVLESDEKSTPLAPAAKPRKFEIWLTYLERKTAS